MYGARSTSTNSGPVSLRAIRRSLSRAHKVARALLIDRLDGGESSHHYVTLEDTSGFRVVAAAAEIN